MSKVGITPEELAQIEKEYEELEQSIPDDEIEQEKDQTVEKLQEEKSRETETGTPVENVVSNNGHNGNAEIPEETSIRDKHKEQLEKLKQIQSIEREERLQNIPGWGSLVGASDDVLDEMTILNEREILLFAIGDTKDEMINPNRTESIAKIFRRKIKKYKISGRDDEGHGQGRRDLLDARQQEAEKAANAAARGAAFGRPQ